MDEKTTGNSVYLIFALVVIITLLYSFIVNAKAIGLETENKALREAIRLMEQQAAETEAIEGEEGEHTLFLYYPDGHTGYVHVTQYYSKDGLLHYTTVGGAEEVTSVQFTQADGYITGDNLLEYGYLEIPMSEWYMP